MRTVLVVCTQAVVPFRVNVLSGLTATRHPVSKPAKLAPASQVNSAHDPSNLLRDLQRASVIPATAESHPDTACRVTRIFREM